jgi:protein TonB
MTEGGFLEQKSGSRSGLVIVAALHVAAFTALALSKGPQFIRDVGGPIVITPIPIPDPPPPNPDPPPPQPESRLTTPPISDPLPIPDAFPHHDPDPFPHVPDPGPAGTGYAEAVRPQLPTPAIRREAEILAVNLQPPYPTDEQRDGSVRLRVSIGPDGRVTAVERISATSSAFWRVTERQALSRWRFRPATLGGRPIASSKVMTVIFRLDEA